MNRKQLLEKAFQRGRILTLKNPVYKSWIEKFIVDETKGDIGKKGDITSNAVINNGNKTRAIVISREKGIIAGLEEAVYLYKKNDIKAKKIKNDGDLIKKGDIILKLEGTEKNLLKIERSALDLLQRMSGIATLTHSVISSIKNSVPIATTRKTQWRYLDKKAVYIGGGMTHRLALWEAILIKDNHIKALEREGIKEPVKISLERAFKSRKKANFIEIEVSSLRRALIAAMKIEELHKKDKSTIFLIMLDNMKPKRVQLAVNKLKKLNLYNSLLIEASGGIVPKNIKSYAKAGIDVISMGCLTHSAKALDIKEYIL
ncbi:carboxylating nicotinate-nucleotide diphosphorylase [Candidatus Woesearchaeota archaeon]|nr:carboxylating nicotinate-nucleotide diphosphorylase [Candidatus Woesearchaeota archaeon]